MDTIFAEATARGRAGISVIRISGPKAHALAEAMAGPLPVAGRALRFLRDGDAVLDQALVLTFAPGQSFTGEAVAELHLHGSPAVVRAVIGVLGRQAEARPAEAGEFTRRALMAGRMDLAQVEGLADLLAAETEVQRRQALRMMSGDLGRQAEAWRRDLIRALALVEATIDFADEEVPTDVSPEVGDLVRATLADLRRLSDGVRMAERIRDGFEIAIIGPPNAGKSTLLNRLAGREAALTSEHAGTTRDVIEVRMEIDGLAVTLLDTAGLRDTTDEVERLGIQRARSRADGADLRVILVPAGEEPAVRPSAGDILLTAKDDSGAAPHGISGLTGAGVDALVTEIGARLLAVAGQAGLATRDRHRIAMERCAAHLEVAMSQLPRLTEQADLAAEELRLALRAIDALVGKVDVDDILDVVFASFCIGK